MLKRHATLKSLRSFPDEYYNFSFYGILSADSPQSRSFRPFIKTFQIFKQLTPNLLLLNSCEFSMINGFAYFFQSNNIINSP